MKAQHDRYPWKILHDKTISTFVKIRISNSNLNIEKGRYFNTPAENRIHVCKLCNSGVEDEFHFTIICSKLQSCREEFFKDICCILFFVVGVYFN
jgi:hypothetical protein